MNDENQEVELTEASTMPVAKDYTALLEGDPQTILDRHKETAVKLLGISIDYCEKFVPEQITALESHISKINNRIDRSGNAAEVQNLAASLLALMKSHSEVLERAVIVYMSNTRPLVSLLTTAQLEISAEAMNPQSMSEKTSDEGSASDGQIFNDDISDEDLDAYHQPYVD